MTKHTPRPKRLGTRIRLGYKLNLKTGCWDWQKSVEKNGYGKMWRKKGSRLAHRISYEVHVGRIPANKEIDHLCNNRGCINPKHLKLASARENVLRGGGPSAQNSRKTHCPKGHPYKGKNLELRKLPSKNWPTRFCLTCRAEKVKMMRSKNG